MRRCLMVVAGLLWVTGSMATDIYRCESSTGVRYADEPCGADAEKIPAQDNRIGGNFGQNLPPRREPDSAPDDPSAESPASGQANTCRFINSTDLRRYLIRGQVVKGMTREQVTKAFGRPPETYPTPQETWVYQTKYYGALYELTYVYFKDGCVEEVVYRKP